MANKWYYSRNSGKVVGPCSSLSLKKLAATGHLAPDDLVGRNRIVRLVKAGTVKGLFAGATG
jgi:hypothetical protein